jgi:hypothetical protein
MIYCKLKKRVRFPTILLSILLLISCGGGGGGGDDDDETASDTSPQKKAYFIDSGVSNLAYSSPSYQGFTDNNGGFPYESGETTTFSAFGLILGSVVTTVNSATFTPLDLFSTTDVKNQSVKNALVFLQSLDIDQIAGNGIDLNHWDPMNEPDFSSLDITSTTFQNNLVSALENTDKTIPLVSELDALEHFENTIIKLNATTFLEGRWISRSMKYGDVNGVYTFLENDTLTLTEFENCSDDDVHWMSTEAFAKRNCREINHSMTTDLKGKELTMTGDKFSDSCTIISSSSYLIEANCEFEGSGLGTEFTRFERDITELNNKLVASKYRELQGGSVSYNKLTFNPDLTGSYHYIDKGGKVTQEDTGDFTWETSPSVLTYTGTDGAGKSFTGTLAFGEDVQGAWKSETSSETNNETNNETSILIPDFDDSLVNNFFSYGTLIYVYDAIKGNCKSLYNFNNVSEGSSQGLLAKNKNGGNPDACDASEGVRSPDGSSADDYNIFISEKNNGAFVIEKSSHREICWPVSYSTTSDAGIIAFLACSINDQPFKFEIWRSL